MATCELEQPRVYEAPTLAWERETAEVEPYVWWAVVVGWSFTVALAYAAYCTWRGGDPSISFGWSGFKVSCNR